MAMRKALLLALLAAAEADEHHKRECVRKEVERCVVDSSPGPEDADIEIKLAGLPASTSTEAVHLNWWAARKSPRTYNPLDSLVNCSVYGSVHHAYPNYDDADFNGGNVQVTSAGEATIRVRSPAAHMVWRWVSLPHIHMRLCNQSGTSAHVMKFRPKLTFTGREIWAWPRSDSLSVVSAHAYAAKDASKAPAESSEAEPPLTWITWASTDEEPEVTTTLPKTTTAHPTTSTFLEKSKQPIRNMKDLDALEFSPVYDCMLGNQFFDHFSNECVDKCPKDKDVAHGQCVTFDLLGKAQNYTAAWDLTLECGENCWAEARNGTLHQLRLIVAGELKIPFQEIEVAVEPRVAFGRRLSAAANLHAFHMTVDVHSARVSVEEFTEKMQPFPHDAESLTTVLGMHVGSISRTSPLPTPPEESLMKDNNDPYIPAYDDAERHMKVGGASPLDDLPTAVVVGLAAGIVSLAAFFVAFLAFRRRRQRKLAEEQHRQNKVEQKEADLADAEKNEAEDKAAAETNGEPKRWI